MSQKRAIVTDGSFPLAKTGKTRKFLRMAYWRLPVFVNGSQGTADAAKGVCVGPGLTAECGDFQKR